MDCSKLPAPCVAILDPFANYAVAGIRSFTTPEQLPIVAWVSGSAGCTLMLWGPERYGGRGNYPSRMQEQIKNGKAQIEAFGSELVFGPTDSVLRIPGYPLMYDYERQPQTPPEWIRGADSLFMEVVYKSIMASEGVITISSPVIEKESIKACDEYFGSLGKSYFSIGPMAVIPNDPKEDDATTDKVFSFLEKMNAEFGEKSVIYIAFGTLLWPTNTSVFNAIIDGMMDNQTPFIVAHPSPVAQPSEVFLNKIRAYPYGLELAWAPQERILSHSATGWFLTHGGWNSMQEAFTYKVPMLLWPTSADQPLNASLLSIKFRAAFELIEVRTGEHGQKMPYRYRDGRDGPTPKFTAESAKEEFEHLLKDLKGMKGSVVRKNFEDLAMEIGRVWDEDGDARKALEAFLNKYLG
ncbi:hypothetical protein E1B28_009473 [Marasmius oreades]|uniref:UDP-Glycosyltransferase/glycogen phosphorylase n=1 Tax=Marasmius oreades TaxID=181124 RepID=A0A9P7RVS7_9AGAR|nr:uncharacterized protein E1B28_009473 [Marasmius oreades]KAG7090353.1 hypothetical protein E1B28_009473 [Marasmius oreades]